MVLALVVVEHRDGDLVKTSTRLLGGESMRILVLDDLVRTRTPRPSRRLGGKRLRILPPPLSAALKIRNGLAWLVPALVVVLVLVLVVVLVLLLADPKRA